MTCKITTTLLAGLLVIGLVAEATAHPSGGKGGGKTSTAEEGKETGGRGGRGAGGRGAGGRGAGGRGAGGRAAGGRAAGGAGGRMGSGRGQASPANALFEAIDADGDGMITSDELKDALRAIAELDKNDDGKISATEASSTENAPAAGRGGRRGAAAGGGRGGAGGGRGASAGGGGRGGRGNAAAGKVEDRPGAEGNSQSPFDE